MRPCFVEFEVSCSVVCGQSPGQNASSTFKLNADARRPP